MNKAFVPRFIGGAFLLAISLAMLLNCKRGEQADNSVNSSAAEELAAEYMGRESCKTCHEKEYNLFQGSDHDLAMDVANEETVLGDFNNVSFTHFGVTSRFYMSEGKFMVNTEGPDGTLEDYQV
ncbi:MAG: hypothetical protein KAR16_15450, partial [Bacteroidales bacterium]|nr:hypothetical protein [Bacteroidales bacterium]